MNEEESVKIKASIEDLKAALSNVQTKIRKYDKINDEFKRKISFEKFRLRPVLPEPNKKEELLDIITGFIDELPYNEEIVVPEKMIERYVPFDIATLEKEILKSHNLTVKQIGCGLQIAETQALVVVVTFQSCR